MLLAKTSSRPR